MWMAWRPKADRRGPVWVRAASIAVWLALGCSTASSASATQVDGAHQGSLDKAVLYLQETQGAEGGWGGAPGAEPNPGFTAWAALALAAAGINPQEQAKPGDASAYTYLTDHAGELKATTDYALALLVVDASGASPEEFGELHLVKQILDRQIDDGREDGAFFHEEAGERPPAVNDTIFAILALSPSQRMEGQGVTEAVKRAADWLIGEQNTDGSWPSVCPKTICAEVANVDMTAAAIEALNAAGLHDTEAQAKALEFLHTAQNPDGGFPEAPGEGESNSASTAWVLQGLWASGQAPETWQQPGGHEPLGYLESMQQTNGSIQWKASDDENPIWMTAYTGPALAGLPLPIPEPPPSHQPPPGDPPASEAAPEAGQDGNSSQPGGVIVGGGGAGAPLFSRPQPQSVGHTPGGARQLVKTRRGAAFATRRDSASRRTTERPSTPEAVLQGSQPGRGEGAAKRGQGAANNGSGTGGDGAGGFGRAAAAGGDGGGGSDRVTGVVLGDSLTAFHSALQAGAPGLRGAAAGGHRSPWPALAIALAAAALALLGAHLERKRPRFLL
jgi:hypothetical protein